MRPAAVIVNWNSEKETLATVENLASWSAVRPEIIVVDNGSTDGSAGEIAARCPGTVLLRNRTNRGYAGGNNDGIGKALELGCDPILLLNNDADIDEKSLGLLIEDLDSRPELGVVGPVLREQTGRGYELHYGGRDIARFQDTRQRKPPGKARPGNENFLFPVDYVPGTALLVRAEVYRKTGTLDERFFFSGEIADFCEKARRLGYESAVDLRASAMHHPDMREPSRSTLRTYYSLRNRFLFVRNNREGTIFVPFVLWTMRGVLLAGSALLTGRRDRARALILALADGLRGRWGNRNELFGA